MMARELIRYRNGKAALQDTLIPDQLPITCSRCDAEYRLHYSAQEINRPKVLELLRDAAKRAVDDSHDLHPDSLAL